MKALLIKPTEQAIEPIEITNKDEIIQLIGHETVIADEIGNDGDHLFFDEECFLRGTKGRFQLDNLIPVSGLGVIIASNDDGTLADCKLDMAAARSRIKFLD